jgi:hypothetical protein
MVRLKNDSRDGRSLCSFNGTHAYLYLFRMLYPLYTPSSVPNYNSEKPAIGSYRNLPYAHQAAKYIRGSRENLSCRESLLDAERRNARRGYENESEALKYLQEYAGKVGEKRRWRSQAIQDRVEDRGPWSGDRRKG